jgi:short subunit dehydrogenase-like uncharacterized protein
MDARPWLLYGATGYTGGLVAEACARRRLEPVLAGRDAHRLAGLAGRFGLRWVAAGLQDPARLRDALRGMALVLNCAGPFSATSAPLRQACLDAGVHYLDITGEIDVFEAAHAEDARARAAGVLLCPGVGFDVVPTDCVAACLKEALPDATHLALGFGGLAQVSPGTAATSLEGLRHGAARVRRDGRIVDVAFGEGGRLADFGRGAEPSFLIPWGDVATAYYSTGIPNVEVHVPRRSSSARAAAALLPLRGLLASAPARRLVHAVLRRTVGGPSAHARARNQVHVWGEVRNGAGETRTARLVTADGYSLTVATALMAVRHVLAHGGAGYATPSQLMGPRCVEAAEGGGTIAVEGERPAG